MRAVLNWQTLLAAFFILLPTVLGFYHGVRGKIVIASPEMDDPNFSKTVLKNFKVISGQSYKVFIGFVNNLFDMSPWLIP